MCMIFVAKKSLKKGFTAMQKNERGKYRSAVKKAKTWGFGKTGFVNSVSGALLEDPTLNPANLLQAVGSNPAKRGREKVNHTLLWLAIFIRSTQAVVLRRLSIEGRGWMRKLEKAGLVKPVLSNVNSGELWVLSPQGLLVAQGVWGQEFKHYPKRPERLSQVNLRHDLAVQSLVADLMATGEATAFKAGSDIARNPQAWRPDAIIKHREGHWLAIEYERSPKYNEELIVKLNRIVTFLNVQNKDKFCFGVRWYSHDQSCLTNYRATMTEQLPQRRYIEELATWMHDPTGPKVRNLAHADRAVESCLLPKDIAKYM